MTDTLTIEETLTKELTKTFEIYSELQAQVTRKLDNVFRGISDENPSLEEMNAADNAYKAWKKSEENIRQYIEKQRQNNS
jgi:hypothetical protein